MTNIAVFCSGGGTNLQALIDGIKSGKITNGRLSLVISSKDEAQAYALVRARDNNIPAEIIKRKDHPDEKEFSEKILEKIDPHDIGLIVLAGFLSVLSADFLKLYENKIINVHPALIPAFCGKGFYGLKVHEQALLRGVKLSGATVHFANEITDGGPIILQKAIEVKDDDTPESLQKRIMTECERPLLVEAVNLFCNGRLEVLGNRVRVTNMNEVHMPFTPIDV
ncbi:MAG: phosphoribosylglycinamide formyltransferase [Oscillospiraceae bacterium]|nr:phosphoribosylglycinamide formyltransferase [Oscillospiraceae bacterium]